MSNPQKAKGPDFYTFRDLVQQAGHKIGYMLYESWSPSAQEWNYVFFKKIEGEDD